MDPSVEVQFRFHAMTSYHNLAICMRNQGKVPEAEHWHRNALGSRKEVLGKRHPISKGRMLENISECHPINIETSFFPQNHDYT